MTDKDTTQRPRYRVLVGLNYHGKRVEPGDVRRDIPERSVEWLLKRKAIEEVDD